MDFPLFVNPLKFTDGVYPQKIRHPELMAMKPGPPTSRPRGQYNVAKATATAVQYEARRRNE